MASTEIRQDTADIDNFEERKAYITLNTEEYFYNRFCQWLDIANRCIYITISKEREFIADIIEYSNTKQGKLTIYIFSVGLTNDEFKETFPGMLEDFEERKVITHNYKVAIDIDAYDIIPKFEKIRDEMKDEKKSFIVKMERPSEVQESKDNQELKDIQV